jgi:hypothetical protein
MPTLKNSAFFGSQTEFMILIKVTFVVLPHPALSTGARASLPEFLFIPFPLRERVRVREIKSLCAP